jgi:hypothetical protein
MHNDDFTNGDPDYCTSCHMGTHPVLDLGMDKPTCILDVPMDRAIVIIQNNRMLGVSENSTAYGGAKKDGERTDETNKAPDHDKIDGNMNGQNNTGGQSGSNSTNSGGKMTTEQIMSKLNLKLYYSF